MRPAVGLFAFVHKEIDIWPVLMPVPTVSFATRYLHTSAGVMVTASHNPSKYNGYKVYGADGCQITTEAAAEILTEIEKLDIFADVRTSGFEAGVANGNIQYIPDEVYTAFVEQVKSQSVLFGEEVNKNAAIVYSPLNGTGLKPVTRTLKEMGYTNITVVKEQEQPDGNFPTCPYPNPEIKEAMALGMEYAKKCNADLLLATDPDCDRVGIAVKNKAGEYELLTGNQTGMLLLDYICSQRVKHGKMPADPVMVKTILNDPVLLKFMAVGYHFPVGYAIINSTKHYGEGPTWSNDAFVHTVCRSWKRGRSSVPTAAGNLQGATRRAVFRQAPCWQAGIPWATSRAWTARASSTGAWRTTALSG